MDRQALNVGFWDVENETERAPVRDYMCSKVSTKDVEEFCRRYHYTGTGGGMQMERIIDAIHIASSKGHLPNSAVYPYMAKIVWNWIGELEEEIAQEVAKAEPRDEADAIANEDEAWRSAYEHVHELYMGEIVGGAILRHHIDGSSNRVPAAYRHERESAA